MAVVEAFFVVFCLLLSSASGQRDLTCSALNVESDGLSVCAISEAQCCSQDFLSLLTRQAGSDLTQGLRDQLLLRANAITQIINMTYSYLEGDFLNGVRQNIPSASLLGSQLDGVTSALNTLLDRANFVITSSSPEIDTVQIFQDILSRIKMVIRNSGLLTSEQSNCVAMQLDQHLRSSSFQLLGQSLENVRRSFTGISRIVRFLEGFAATITGTEYIPERCVRRLLEVSYCGRCTGDIPPLCENTCGALVRGCYAAFYSGLERESENLWSVVRQLVSKVDSSVRDLFMAENDLLDISFGEVVGQCQILFGRRKRQLTDSEMLLPSSIVDQANQLSGGIFNYEMSEGPVFCRPELPEQQFCIGRGTEDRRCASREVCTRACQCWDGEQRREADIEEFTGVSIEDQARNPVISVPMEENVKIAQTLATPINAFLTSEEFTEIMPEGITIPPPAPYSTEGDGSGSIPLVVSVITLLGTVLLALLFA